MPRYVEITLRKRGIACAAPLDEQAPRTCPAQAAEPLAAV